MTKRKVQDLAEDLIETATSISVVVFTGILIVGIVILNVLFTLVYAPAFVLYRVFAPTVKWIFSAQQKRR